MAFSNLIAFTEDDLKALMLEAAELAVSRAFAALNLPGQENITGNEKPITGKELCAFLGISAPTLIRYRKKGRIPSIKIGSKILYNRGDVVKALDNKKNR